MDIKRSEIEIYQSKLRHTMMMGFLIRLGVLIFILTLGNHISKPYFIADDIKYEIVARVYMNNAESLFDPHYLKVIENAYIAPFWPWVVGIVAYLFKSIYASRFLNIAFSTITIGIIFNLTYEVSGEGKSALRAARLFAYLPVTIMTCCFPIKDIFLTMAVMYAFYMFMRLKNSKRLTLFQIILTTLLLVCVYYTRGAVVELMIIFLLINVLLKYANQKKYITMFFWFLAAIVIFMLIRNMIMTSFETKMEDYGGGAEEGGITFVQVNSIKDIYKLPVTIFFANLQPITLNFFTAGKATFWYRIISHLNVSIYPIAIGNTAYIFMKKKDLFFWLSTFIMYSAVVVLSTGVFRHYLFLLPVQLINYSVCTTEEPQYENRFLEWSVVLLVLVGIYSAIK